MGQLALVLSRNPLSKEGSGAGAARDARVGDQAEVRGDRATCVCVQAVAMVASVAARFGVMEV